MIGWVDLETTGLQDVIETGAILEIAVVVTDDNLNTLGTFNKVARYVLPQYLRDVAIHRHPQMVYASPSDGTEPSELVFNMHRANNLWNECDASEYDIDTIDQMCQAWLRMHIQSSPADLLMGGANVGSFDRRWMERWMPRTLAEFHYRSLDISTIKNAVRLWAGNIGNPPEGSGQHRAMPDILDSIEVMRFYRQAIFNKEPK